MILIAWSIVASFCMGACVGSFLNVCVYRLPREGMTVSNPRRSICFTCGKSIAWHDNIPIFSWFLLRGRCRNCAAPFSIRYSMVETLTGILFTMVFLRFARFPEIGGVPVLDMDLSAILIYWVFVSALVVVSFVDIDHFIIPDEISKPGIVIACILGVLIPFLQPETGIVSAEMGRDPLGLIPSLWPDLPPGPAGALNSLLGGAFGGGFLWALGFVATAVLKREAMGFGDVKLFTMVGFLLGIEMTFLALMLSAFAGMAISGTIHVIKRRERFSHIPYGPYLALGAVLALLWGREILYWRFGFLLTLGGGGEGF